MGGGGGGGGGGGSENGVGDSDVVCLKMFCES